MAVNSENVAKTLGRFRYIEPTNMNLNIPDNAITFPYEDYSIGVKLEVTVPNRFSCGMTDGNTIEFSSDNGTIEFFGGTGSKQEDVKNGIKAQQGYLTTSFTDVSSNNVSTGNRETLGIESINIAYQQWFYPIVNIRFVDVRGASLFMPQEMALQQTVADEHGDPDKKWNITQINGGSFFKAIFACPSPVFRLTVKGFYGKSVTFNLKMSAFQTEFDSENGNFIANVEFIGNMYGVYTEIPLQYLAVAPYLNKEYWDANRDERFAFRNYTGNDSNGTRKRMLTFPEFYKAVRELQLQAEKKIQDWKKENNYNDILERIKNLETLKDNFPFDYSRYPNKWNTYKANVGGENHTIYYFVSEGYKDGHDWFGAVNGNNIDVADVIKSFYNDVKSFVDSNGITYQPMLQKVNSLIYPSGDKEEFSYYPNKLGKFKIVGKTVKDYKTDTLIASPFTDTQEKVYKSFVETNKEDGTRYIFEFDGQIIDYIKELIDGLTTQKEEKEKLLEEFLYQDTEETLGFKLSIGNIFRMLFAHLDCFTDAYYNMLNAIRTNIQKNDESRQLKTVTHSMTDIPENISMIPPFPLVYGKAKDDTEKEEFKWPEDYDVAEEECEFVKRLINAAAGYYDAMKDAENALKLAGNTTSNDTLNGSSKMMINVTLYDFINNNGIENPYARVINSSNDWKKTAERIKTIFTLRCLYAIYLYGDDGRKADLSKKLVDFVAWAEALNVRKVIGPEISKELKEELAFSDNNGGKGNELMTYLQGKKGTPYWKSISEGRNLLDSNKYTLIKNGNDYLLPLRYNIEEIQEDINPLNNEHFVNLTTTSANTGGFRIFENDGFIEEWRSGLIQNADISGIGTKRNNIFDEFVDSVLKENSKKSKIDYYFTFKKVERKDNGEKYILIEAKEDELTDNNPIITCSGLNSQTKQKVNELHKSVCFGYVNNGPVFDGAFQSGFYKEQKQNDLLAKAYCFIFSIPIIQKTRTNINTGTISNFSLLQEGAYYWRKKCIVESNEDPLTYNKFNVAMKGQAEIVPILVNGTEGYGLASINNDALPGKYKTWGWLIHNSINGTESRINKLIDIFKKFAESSEFNELKNYLEDKNRDMNDDTIIEKEKILLKILEGKSFVIDYCTRPDGEDIPKKFQDRDLINSYEQFLTYLNEIYGNTAKTTTDESDDLRSKMLEVNKALVNDEHIRNSTYLTLKGLYDKYFSNIDRKRFFLPENKDDGFAEFNKFLFMDTYYNDISDKLLVNSSFITSLLKEVTFNTSESFNTPDRLLKNMSVYEFMSEICQNCFTTLLALPQRFGISQPRYMEEMFTPHPYSSLNSNDIADGCYIAIYSYEPSKHLDLLGQQYAYKNDSFDIESSLPSALSSIPVNGLGTFEAIPAFGVTYAKQNQSLFKRLSLTTANQQVTEQSITATMDVSAKANEGPRESTLYGQDLYRVYSNYAYQCTVEMMGNIQIMPLMYFQLNNVSMWHGAYMIISVEHNIEPGNMTTKFTGVRVNTNSIPLVDAKIITRNDAGERIEIAEGGTVTSNVNNGQYGIDYGGNVTDREAMIIEHTRKEEGHGYVGNDNGAGCCRDGFLLTVLKKVPGLENMTCELLKTRGITDAEWVKAFEIEFYNPLQMDKFKNDSIALLIFDWCFNAGKGKINNIKRLFGFNTGTSWNEVIDNINGLDEEEAFSKIWNYRKDWYRHICTPEGSKNWENNKRWLDAWLRRVDRIKFKPSEPSTA